MASLHVSGGGRRQHVSLWRRRIRPAGRFMLAVSAGVAFGYLAYDRPHGQASEESGFLPQQPKPQPGGVTDDASRLRIGAEREAADLSTKVGWLRTGVTDDTRRANENRQREASSFTLRTSTRADREHGAGDVLTAPPHSRGPPPMLNGGTLW